ncbi:hypothetical protein R5R35_006632 [Gryllus longicercus]|uniref:Protein regulator of cytokinesis 1 n=1 Tax=Gryllus longicercus TaxID=2509291 RepID=A0AAN9VEM4_9ORTH
MGGENIRTSCTDALRKVCEKKVQTLVDIWKTIGHPNLQMKVEELCNNVEQLFNEMIEEEAVYQCNLAAHVEELLEEAALLCQNVNADHDNIIEGLEDSNISLLRLQDILNDRLKEYRLCKEDRLNTYHELLEKERQLCSSLGLRKRPALKGVPKEEELEEFSNYIAQKFEEKKVMYQQFDETKKKIEEIYLELGTTPDISARRILDPDSPICCSSENVILMKELHQDMEQKLEKVKSESIEIRETLSKLWDCLNIEYSEREAILQQYPGHSISSIDALKAQVQKYERKKDQNIRMFVEASRAELADLWIKCGFGEKQRQHFYLHYYSNCFTEDLLEIHETEIKKLKSYFSENSDILELARKREILWEKMIEMEERVHDPKRFANRGGNLLREEKERSAIRKDLPALDKELKALLGAYEKKHKAAFLYEDNDLRDSIQSKWDDFQKKKKEEKLARRKGKANSQEDEELTTVIRKIPNTPATIPRKTNKSENKPTRGVNETESCKSERHRVRRIFAKRDKQNATSRSQMSKVDIELAPPDSLRIHLKKSENKASGNETSNRRSSQARLPLRENNRRDDSVGKRVDFVSKTPPRGNSANAPGFRTPQLLQSQPRERLTRIQSAPRLRQRTSTVK